jgi:hypothetical protein
MPIEFAVTFDYLCPFARNLNEHVATALDAGADWDVTFTPYSLTQGHLTEEDVAVWDRADPHAASGVLALQAGLAVRDRFPDRFLVAHRELFAARHDRGENLKDPDVVAKALAAADLDPDEVFTAMADGAFLAVLRDEHRRNVEVHGIWGVPTVIAGDRAVFVRLLDRPDDDAARARDRIERVITLVTDFPDLHEFKQVDLPF